MFMVVGLVNSETCIRSCSCSHRKRMDFQVDYGKLHVSDQQIGFNFADKPLHTVGAGKLLHCEICPFSLIIFSVELSCSA